jgi:hypothetical protein
MADGGTTRFSRRALGRLTVGAAGLASGLAFLPSRALAWQAERQEASDPGAVEQAPIKRAGTGLRAWDPTRAWNGFTLFKRQAADPVVHLIDMAGSTVHQWRFPYGGVYAHLTERGTLFYNGLIPRSDYPGRPLQAGVALEADWDGRILWEVRNPDHHHDGVRLSNGNVLLLCSRPLPEDLAAQVQGGLAGTEKEWGMDGDYLQEVTLGGQVVWEWYSWEHLDPVADGIPWPMDSRGEWGHANGISVWPNGNINVSFRNLSQVVTVDRQTGEIIWKLGSPPLSGQHAPTPLPNGNLLIFDNGPHRFDSSLPFSRVLEIDVASKDIVWSYQEARASDFFSPRISNAQRLPNGNTLINEGWFGRFFEVTPAGDVVWEYVNPNFGPGVPNPEGNIVRPAEINPVFRAYRYSAEEIERAQATASYVDCILSDVEDSLQ